MSAAEMVKAAARPLASLLLLRQAPILQQLQLEEALLRSTTGNWIVINTGAATPAIVMGISGKLPDLVHPQVAAQQGLQVIKRFTGGGTVVVDEDTLFATLIVQGESLPSVESFPVPIMRWTEEFYRPVFAPYGPFALRDNDYVFGERKFGGNAQAITSRRWCHHTSFLWDFDPRRMAALKQPAKQPAYRQGREHGSFVMRLSEVAPSRNDLLQAILATCHDHFQIQEVEEGEASQALGGRHLRSNQVVDLAPYLEAAP